MTRKNWSREETILALYLYCKTPFGKIHKGNENIINMAKLMGRTPSALGLKMCNLAAVDPTLEQKGMNHGSKLDVQIFEEFCNNWDELANQAYEIIKALDPSNNEVASVESDIPEGTDKISLVKQRIGQNFFRNAVLASYDYQCCITEIASPNLLRASHIKPWTKSNPTEKTNPANGLCLNPFHDHIFDKGYISLNDDYKVLVSPEIRKIEMDAETKSWLYHYEGKRIILPKSKVFVPNKQFLEFHRDTIFRI